jgi:hypothetical protein
MKRPRSLGIAYEKFEAAQAEVARLRAAVERVRAVPGKVVVNDDGYEWDVYDAAEIDAALEPS